MCGNQVIFSLLVRLFRDLESTELAVISLCFCSVWCTVLCLQYQLSVDICYCVFGGLVANEFPLGHY